eukprot:m.248590 g.248590  ORF g.248590 m.248590 type:complete len:50 (-) comp16134_c1_seq1:348-497(-)
MIYMGYLSYLSWWTIVKSLHDGVPRSIVTGDSGFEAVFHRASKVPVGEP